MDTIIGNLANNVGIGIGLVVGLLCLAFWVVNKVATIKANHSTLTDSAKRIEESLLTLARDFAFVKGSLDAFSKSSLTQRNSPISLTDKGKEVSLNLGLQERITKNWDKILKHLNTNISNKNAYDIQQYCLENSTVNLDAFFHQDDIMELKNKAFLDGSTMFQYGSVIGILIRDRYMEEKGISIEDIDKHDPNK